MVCDRCVLQISTVRHRCLSWSFVPPSQEHDSLISECRLEPSHGAEEEDQDHDCNQRERRTREKLRRPVEALAAPGLHKGDERENESDSVTNQRNGNGSLWGPSCSRWRNRPAGDPETEKEERRESELLQMIHAPA